MVNKLHFLFLILRPVGLLYSLLMQARFFLYKKNYLQVVPFNIPVISVGNLTMGGSGKTPFVLYLARMLKKNGLETAIISRGYGGKAKGEVNIVSDGVNIFLNHTEAGDEPRMIAESVPGIPVLTGKKRIFPCRHAANVFKSDILILDDGFQHLSVGRDIDIVLFNASELFSHFHVFPGGLLREPFRALDRATCVCITGCTDENAGNVKKFMNFLAVRFPNIPSYTIYSQPICFTDINGQQYPLEYLQSPIFAFCGIASPQRFKKTLEKIGLTITSFVDFQDHKIYDIKTVENLVSIAKMSGASCLVTTEKDLVKLRSIKCELPLFALPIEIKDNPSFNRFIMNRLSLCLK